MTVREVTDADCRLLWEWVNDPAVRTSAFRSAPVPWDEHVSWFAARRRDPRCHMYVLEDEHDAPVGQVRFDVGVDGVAEIDLSIAAAARGRGYATQGLRLACARVTARGDTTGIRALVKPGNVASLRAFERAGFVVAGAARVGGQEAVVLTIGRAEALRGAPA